MATMAAPAIKAKPNPAVSIFANQVSLLPPRSSAAAIPRAPTPLEAKQADIAYERRWTGPNSIRIAPIPTTALNGHKAFLGICGQRNETAMVSKFTLPMDYTKVSDR
jgi:hypothetical protein